MSRKKTQNKPIEEAHTDISIVEAVENLSNIAEMDGGEKLGIIEDHVVVHEESEDDEFEAIQWLEEKSLHKTETVVEDTYRAVLKYVNTLHQKEFNRFYDDKNQEGIKKIMLLVGKASDNLNNFTHLFKGSHKEGVEGTHEYQQLSKFYKERIAVAEEEKVSLIDLSRKARELEAVQHPLSDLTQDAQFAKQFVLDIEKIKTDDHYELLYLERDHGGHYYSQDFLRNLKAACNFGEYVGKNSERNPLEACSYWLEEELRVSAGDILKMLKPYLDVFYKEALKYKDMEVVSSINMALMALMLASQTQNKVQNGSIKGCRAYFQDYQHYLRQALSSFEYHKLKSFPPPSSNIFLHNLMDIISLLSWSCFFHSLSMKGLHNVMDDMIEEGKMSSKKHRKEPSSETLDQLEESYLHLSRYLMNFPVGPLFKTLQSLRQGVDESFDNIALENLPFEWASFTFNDQKTSLIQLPSPTVQTTVNKVTINQEFIGLLDAYKSSKVLKKHLLINLQDRTNWTEEPRCKCLESIPKKAEYAGVIEVITLNKESDFYHQRGDYQKESSIKNFFKQITFQMHSEQTGFYFPGWISEEIFNGFVKETIQQIHRFFFASKSTLSQKERCNFIEIFYQMIILKIVEIYQPDSMSFTCKDAMDVGASSMSLFYGFIKMMQGKELTQDDIEQMRMVLFAMPMLHRERCIHAENFNRLIAGLQCIRKQVKDHMQGGASKVIDKYFGELFDHSLVKVKFEKPSLKQIIKETND